MDISNVEVLGIRSALIRAGYPMQTIVNEVMRLDQTPMEKLVERGKRLAHSPIGHGDDKFLRQIVVTFDVRAPRYWWQQFATYGHTVMNSQSTMHKGAKLDYRLMSNRYVDEIILTRFEKLVENYNRNPTKENFMKVKSNLPEGIEITAGISTNYAQLRTIYFQRKSHRLPEWNLFCEWIETLPYAKDFICG